MPDQPTGLTRRGFLPATAGAIMIVPRHVLGAGYTAPSDKLNIAAVGVGGMGQNYVKGCASENIVAIADVDHAYAAPVFQKYPGAKVYKDFRVMLEKEKGIDAVIVGTPDHNHAVVASAAIALKKGRVRGQADDAHGVGSARAGPGGAGAEGGHADERAIHLHGPGRDYRGMGEIGRDRDSARGARVDGPAGVAAGAGAAGGEGRKFRRRSIGISGWGPRRSGRTTRCTIRSISAAGTISARAGWATWPATAFHIIVKALGLGAPASVSAATTVIREPLRKGEKPEPDWTRSKRGSYPEAFPSSSMVTWDFPARGDQPAVRMTWYEGGLRPPRPLEMAPDRQLGADGLIFVGEKGTLWSGFTGGIHFLSAEQEKALAAPAKTLPRTKDHYMEWVNACKGGAPANCNFEFAAPLTEIALLGVIAQRTGKYLQWDAEAMRFPNDAAATELLKPQYRTGWSL